MARWLGLFIVLALAGGIAWRASLPPSPQSATIAADAFSAGRAMADVRVIAARPHPTGSAANTDVRAALTARLRAHGFSVRTQAVFLPPRAVKRLAAWGDPDARFRQAVSLIAVRPGRNPALPAVALMAHYDSVAGSPGAGDDAAGVAAALEIARAIPASAQARDLVILFTDAEELGLVGARAIFAAPPQDDPIAARIGVLINLETRGGGGRALMFETSRDAGNLIRLYRDAVPTPATTALAVKIYELLPNSTDFTASKARGIAGYNFAFTGGAALYHSPLATPDAIDAGSLQHMGDQALALARPLLAVSALPAPAPDLAYGDILGLTTLAYAPAWGWLIVAAIAACLVSAGRARRDWRGARVAGAMLDGVVAAAAVAVLAYLGNLLSGADGKTNYYDRLAALPRLEVMALIAAAAGITLTLALAPRHRSRWDGWLGLAALNLLLLVALQIALPVGAPVLAWPLLPAALAMAVAARSPRTGSLLAGAAAVFGLAAVATLGHLVLLSVGIATPGAIAVFAPLALLLAWPLLPEKPTRRPLLSAVALLCGVQAGLALWVRLDPLAPSVAAYDPLA
ncbi:hypothetical protein IP88_03155 [alpha proteobacterium AAP81b]|nr:hypothetical protein IP88_03155 [alpha proteobacterium AAP81b]